MDLAQQQHVRLARQEHVILLRVALRLEREHSVLHSLHVLVLRLLRYAPESSGFPSFSPVPPFSGGTSGFLIAF